jgi:hypothetical protein
VFLERCSFTDDFCGFPQPLHKNDEEIVKYDMNEATSTVYHLFF